MKTLILDNYDSFTYNLYQYCAELGANPEVFRNDKISLREIASRKYTHIIISPGPGSPGNKKDFGVCKDVIEKLAGVIPILGVCLGHQGIIQSFGGKIVRLPVPVHGKRSIINVDNSDILFKNLPSRIEAMRYHSLVGDRKTLPKELKITAETENNIIMAVRHKSLPSFGVQFHPESIGTPTGKQILQNFLGVRVQSFTQKQAEKILDKMARGQMDEEEMAEILKEMASRGETVDEIIGMAKGMRKHALKFPLHSEKLMDTCGTGGSGLPRMNISTAAAFVLAACGVKIAKHGNRAASGKCGSFDLLEKLGININLPPKKIAEAIKHFGIGFLFAPMFHPAMKNIAPVRKRLGIRTIFNILGPLTNPARPKYHLLGTNSAKTAEKMAQAMKKLGYKRAIAAAGSDGLDDITLCGKTEIFELAHGKIKKYSFSPEDAGLKKVNDFKSISGGSAEENAKIFKLLLQGKAPKHLQNLLNLNCAFGLYVAEKAKNARQGLKIASEAIKSGRAYRKFLSYKKYSNEQ